MQPTNAANTNMTITALWTFIGSLVLLTLGITYKWVENAHGLKLAEKEIDRLRSALDAVEKARKDESLGFRAEIDSLQETHQQEISDIKNLHQGEIDKISEEKTKLCGHDSPPANFGFVENGSIKWKAHLVSGSVFKIEDTPYCTKHDIRLHHFRDGYCCFHINEDGCEARLRDNDYAIRRSYVESLAEQQFRPQEGKKA